MEQAQAWESGPVPADSIYTRKVPRKSLGPDPMKNFQRKIPIYAGIWPIKELKKGHMNEAIYGIPAKSKILRWILLIWSGSGLI